MNQRYFLLILPLFGLLLTCCESNPTDHGQTKISTGTSIDVTTRTIPSSGGTITIDRPGDTLDGLEIDVPNGAYPDARNFSISYAPITKHNLGSDLTPLTPVIRIANGGGYAAEPMVIRVPVKIPAGQCAMVFAYDNSTGKLEGLPVISYDSTQITVSTSHVAFGRMSSAAKRADLIDNLDVADLLVIASAINKLTSFDYDSHFRPGVDDWDFENHGSAITGSGNCSGQSTTALYYYSTRKPLTGKALYGLFDTLSGDVTERVWMDNVMGIRYASMAQYRQDWNSLFTKLFRQIGETVTPLLTYEFFALSIAVTNQPQYIAIAGDVPLAGTVSRHAMVVYRAKGGTLYVADPNFPGNPNRSIDYFALGNQFLPYTSGDNADILGVEYKTVHYIAQSAIVRWDNLSKMYKEMLDGTVGQGVFPDNLGDFEVQDDNGNWIKPGRTLVTTSDSIRFRINSARKVKSVWTGFQVTANVFDNAVRLVPGKQVLGFYITDDSDRWLDFKWITVEKKERVNGPDGPTGLNLEVTLTVDGVQTAPFTQFGVNVAGNGTRNFMMRCIGDISELHMLVPGFHGPGTYALPDGVDFPNYWQESSVVFRPVQPGTLTVTEWTTDKFTGNFSLSVKNDQGVSRSISGTFHYNP